MRHTHGHIIEKLLIFRQQDSNPSPSPSDHTYSHLQKDWNFTWRVLPLFQSISFAQFEILYREGDIANECYFILEGRVVFSTRSGKPYRKILSGMHFGQISILKDQSRTENAIAASSCDLLTLSKSDFLQILSEFPEIAREIKEEANQKREFLQIEKEQVKRSNVRPVFRNILATRTLWQSNDNIEDNESGLFVSSKFPNNQEEKVQIYNKQSGSVLTYYSDQEQQFQSQNLANLAVKLPSQFRHSSVPSFSPNQKFKLSANTLTFSGISGHSHQVVINTKARLPTLASEGEELSDHQNYRTDNTAENLSIQEPIKQAFNGQFEEVPLLLKEIIKTMNSANEEYAGIRISIDGLKAEIEKVSALQDLNSNQ